MGITFPDSTTEILSYDDNGQLIRREKYAVGGDGFGDGSGDGNGEAGGGGSPVEVTEYEWNDQEMLVKVILPTGEPVEYFYDGNQRLTGRISADGVDQFVQSGWDIMTKTDDVGKRTYYTGMSAISGAGSSSGSFVSGSSSGSSAVVDEDNQAYFHYDHLGNTRLITDREGNIVNRIFYEAYGKPTDSEGSDLNSLSLKDFPYLFVGNSGIVYDHKTQLHNMRFRWFSATQMRFISPDLLMDLNRYAYVSGNPINNYDPLGLWKVKIWKNRIIAIKEVGDNISNLRKALGNYEGELNSAGQGKYDITPAFGSDIERMLREQYEKKKGNPNVNCYMFAFGVSGLYSKGNQDIFALHDWTEGRWGANIPKESPVYRRREYHPGNSERIFDEAISKGILEPQNTSKAVFGDIIAIHSPYIEPAFRGVENFQKYEFYNMKHFTIYTGIKSHSGLMYVISKGDTTGKIGISSIQAWKSAYINGTVSQDGFKYPDVGTRSFNPKKSPLKKLKRKQNCK